MLCDYNRDGDAWRSPWSNEFEYSGGGPPGGDGEVEGEEGVKPSERTRKMEVQMGEAVEVYREL